MIYLHTGTDRMDRRDWLHARRSHLGASDSPAIMGKSGYASAWSVWAEKSGRVSLDDQMSEPAQWGLLLEPVILDHLEQRRGLWLQRHRMYGSSEYPMMAASPDGVVFEDEPREGRSSVAAEIVVEAKCIDAMAWRLYGEEPLESWIIQVHHQMIVCETQRAIIAVLVGGNRFEEFEIERDERLCERIIAACKDMWRRVLVGDPPDPDGSELTMLAMRRVWERDSGAEVELSPRTAHLVRSLPAVNATIKAATTTRDETKAAVMAEMQEATYATIEGEIVASWRTGKKSRTFRFAKGLE
ncbi:MAG: YqaJ viral recombinase family nuclease [Acidimicrobiales bacterium]